MIFFCKFYTICVIFFIFFSWNFFYELKFLLCITVVWSISSLYLEKSATFVGLFAIHCSIFKCRRLFCFLWYCLLVPVTAVFIFSTHFVLLSILLFFEPTVEFFDNFNDLLVLWVNFFLRFKGKYSLFLTLNGCFLY